METLISDANSSLRETGSLLILIKKMHKVNKKMHKVSQTGNLRHRRPGLLIRSSLALLDISISLF